MVIVPNFVAPDQTLRSADKHAHRKEIKSENIHIRL